MRKCEICESANVGMLFTTRYPSENGDRPIVCAGCEYNRLNDLRASFGLATPAGMVVEINYPRTTVIRDSSTGITDYNCSVCGAPVKIYNGQAPLMGFLTRTPLCYADWEIEANA